MLAADSYPRQYNVYFGKGLPEFSSTNLNRPHKYLFFRSVLALDQEACNCLQRLRLRAKTFQHATSRG